MVAPFLRQGRRDDDPHRVVDFYSVAVTGRNRRKSRSRLARGASRPPCIFAGCGPSSHERHSTARESKCKRESLWTFWKWSRHGTACVGEAVRLAFPFEHV